ncbi:hypothetical protein AMK20_17985 [Streptomyces sp. TSRI0261]|nr:hypothetical protein AMK20_17985 [Streptomyces sp. TSRI0261]
MRAVHKRFQLFGMAEVIGDVCPDEVSTGSGTQGSVGDPTSDPVGHRPLCGTGVCGRVEEQSQLLQYVVEELWRFGFFAPEESSQHGQGRALDPSYQGVQTCLYKPVRSDMSAKCLLTRDVPELIEGVVAGHQVFSVGIWEVKADTSADAAAIEFIPSAVVRP